MARARATRVEYSPLPLPSNGSLVVGAPPARSSVVEHIRITGEIVVDRRYQSKPLARVNECNREFQQLSIVNGNDLGFGFSGGQGQLATRLAGGALQDRLVE